MTTVSVRYIVADVDEAIAFYCGHLGFIEQMHPDPAFAMLTRGDLRLVLVSLVPPGHQGGSRPMPDGTKQPPGTSPFRTACGAAMPPGTATLQSLVSLE